MCMSKYNIWDIWGFPKIRGTFFGGPHNKDYTILGSILGFPCLGKLPYRGHEQVASKGRKTGEHVKWKGILGGWDDTKHV